VLWKLIEREHEPQENSDVVRVGIKRDLTGLQRKNFENPMIHKPFHLSIIYVLTVSSRVKG
jgi:hypothetical protein